MQTTARVIAMDLGASGGKCFAGAFDGKGFSLTEIHRFSHEPTTLHVADRTGRIEERSYWDDLLIYSNMVEGLSAYRREIGSSADSVGIDTGERTGCSSRRTASSWDQCTATATTAWTGWWSR